MPNPIKFCVVCRFAVLPKHTQNRKPLAPPVEIQGEFEISMRMNLSSRVAFNTFLARIIHEKATVSFVAQLKECRGLARTIGRQEWYLDPQDSSLALFVSKQAMTDYLNNMRPQEGNQGNIEFMREALLEIYDDANCCASSRV